MFRKAEPAREHSQEQTQTTSEQAQATHRNARRQLAGLGKKLQAKLKISAPDDRMEREADRVSEQVTSMGGSRPVTGGSPPIISRAPDTNHATGGASPQTPKLSANTESRINSMMGGGRPLSRGERSFYEPRFDRDFSKVRVHTGGDATETAGDINAKAFTVGNNVFFGAGEYQPGSQSGQKLMAHELTHTIQQSSREHPKSIQRDTQKKPGYLSNFWRIFDKLFSPAKQIGGTTKYSFSAEASASTRAAKITAVESYSIQRVGQDIINVEAVMDLSAAPESLKRARKGYERSVGLGGQTKIVHQFKKSREGDMTRLGAYLLGVLAKHLQPIFLGFSIPESAANLYALRNITHIQAGLVAGGGIQGLFTQLSLAAKMTAALGFVPDFRSKRSKPYLLLAGEGSGTGQLFGLKGTGTLGASLLLNFSSPNALKKFRPYKGTVTLVAKAAAARSKKFLGIPGIGGLSYEYLKGKSIILTFTISGGVLIKPMQQLRKAVNAMNRIPRLSIGPVEKEIGREAACREYNPQSSRDRLVVS